MNLIWNVDRHSVSDLKRRHGVSGYIEENTVRKLILASGSLGRRELMTMHGYTFEVKPSNIPEATREALPRTSKAEV